VILPSLLPPQSMDQAEQLSAAGESLIPLLASHWSRDSRKAPETIRAASLIGGADAINLIRDVALQPDVSGISSELSRAWQYFEIDAYAREVLGTRNVELLIIEDPVRLRALAHVPSINRLIIRLHEHEVIDLDIIASLPRLKRLELESTPKTLDLSKLAACRELRSLRFESYPHKDLSPLPSLPSVEDLQFSDSPDLINLTGIEQAQHINWLMFERCDKLTIRQELNKMPDLKDVVFVEIPNLKLPLFRPMPGMTIRLYGCGEVDLAPLAGLRDLNIRYFHTQLSNVDALGEGSSVRNIEPRIASLWPFNR